jgi:N-acyl-D-amino-acid deacylase
MRSLVFKGVADGAVGFSTGLQYVPGTYAKQNEIIELAREAANQGGIYATHMRNEGTELEAGRSPNPSASRQPSTWRSRFRI